MARIRKTAAPARPARTFLRGFGDAFAAPALPFLGTFEQPLTIPRRSLGDA